MKSPPQKAASTKARPRLAAGGRSYEESKDPRVTPTRGASKFILVACAGHTPGSQTNVLFGTDPYPRVWDDVCTAMNTNRKRQQSPQPSIRLTHIDVQDAIVPDDPIGVNDRDLKLPRILTTQGSMNGKASLDEGLGATCLGEH